MFVKTLTFMILGAGLVTQLPPIPEMPIADTGVIFDTGGMDDPVDSTDTGVFADTGEMTDTGGMDDTGSASDSGAPNDTGSANEGSGRHRYWRYKHRDQHQSERQRPPTGEGLAAAQSVRQQVPGSSDCSGC